MSAHAQTIPSIASGIVRLRNAQSASLREKVDKITGRRTVATNSQQHLGEEAHATDEVEKRLWTLCQTRIRPETAKGSHTKKKTEETPAEDLPSQIHLAESEPSEDEELLNDIDDLLHSGALLDIEHHMLLSARTSNSELHEEAFCDTQSLDEPVFPCANEMLSIDDGQLPLDDWTASSEGDYFYTDGHGNIYPVGRSDTLEASEVEWPSDTRLTEPDGFGHEIEEELQLQVDENANGRYIMYNEVQYRVPDPGTPDLVLGAAGQSFLRSHLDGAPWPAGPGEYRFGES